MMKEFEKPSQIWKWAAENLTQTQGQLYDIDMGSYCALGAVGKCIGVPNNELEGEPDVAMKAIFAFDGMGELDITFKRVYGSSIWRLNDCREWSFEDFATVAEMLGY